MTNDELRQALRIARRRRALSGQELGTLIFGPPRQPRQFQRGL
jgi:hypothetical protein